LIGHGPPSPECGPTILVVEDEPITREILVFHLDRAGFATVACATGEGALEVLRAGQPQIDWLVTDINMGDSIDGWVLGAEFHLRHPLRPVIYVSSHLPRSKSNMGSGVYVPKPFSPAAIAELIRKFIAEDEASGGIPAPVPIRA
jgi:CheY-like chemotaxis protein